MVRVDGGDRLLVPMVTVVLHPVDTVVHPTYPPGWRWAVQVGGSGPAELDLCVGAGHEPDRATAGVVGESHGAAVCKGLRLLGVPARYGVSWLDHDPIPAEADERPLTRWGKG